MVAISLAYFAASNVAGPSGSPYDLLLDSSQLADEAGLEAVWLPERHFSDFGHPFPNPSVTAAAVAATTRRIRIRAGSVVLPLHHPARVAEEWAVVDQLSRGRVGISFASGWHATDFLLSRSGMDERRQVMLDGITTVAALWRGEPQVFTDTSGREMQVRTYPRPVQPELPIWITSGGSPPTFEAAGSLGVSVLTHLVGQTPADLQHKIALYRAARAKHDGTRGHVTLMMHTHILDGSSGSAERAQAELVRYLISSVKLDESNAAKPADAVAAQSMSNDDRHAVAARGAAHFLRDGLICTADELPDRIAAVSSWDVDEIACLIDFGFDHSSIMKSLDELLTSLA